MVICCTHYDAVNKYCGPLANEKPRGKTSPSLRLVARGMEWSAEGETGILFLSRH